MEIEFDPDKDEDNRRNHGVSLAVGRTILTGSLGEVEDKRRDYGEVRIRAFGRVEGRLFACTYTLRGGVRRIISVQRVREKEMGRWLASS